MHSQRDRLVEAVGARRFFEPRLTGGFAFGPLVGPSRGDGGRSRLASEDWRLLEAAARARREADLGGRVGTLGASLLVLGHTDEAIAVFERDRRSAPSSAAALSDLAAGHLVRAEQHGRADDLLRALELSSRAIEIEPCGAEALYNRALALDWLALNAQARAAWTAFSSCETARTWRESVAQRLDRRHDPAPDYPRIDRELRDRALGGDADALDAAVRASPGLAKDLFELELLPHVTERTIEARRVASAFRRVTGDAYLEDILREPLGALQTRGGRFAAARRLHDLNRRGAAAPLFASVARSRGQDSLGLWSRMYGAAAQADTDLEGALAALEPVIAVARKRPLPTLLGRSLWLRGIVQISLGKDADALASLDEADGVLHAAGNAEFGPYMSLMRAEAFNSIGNETRSMSALVEAVRGRHLLREEARRLGVLFTASQHATDAALPRTGQAFLAEARPLVDSSPVEFVRLEWLLNWSRTLETEGPGRGLAALDGAPGLLTQVKDPALRERLAVELAISAGEMAVPESPRAALSVVDAGIVAALKRSALFRLPLLHLNAGRLLSREGRHEEAIRHLESGLESFETAPGLEDDLRLSSAQRSFELYGMLLDERIANAEPVERSAAVAERAYALSFDGASGSKSIDVTSMAPEHAVIAYFFAARGLVGLVVRSTGVRLHRLDLPEDLRLGLADPRDWLQGDPRDREARLSELSRVLLAPLEADLRGATRIAIVPHRQLYNVPFWFLSTVGSARPWGATVGLSLSPSIRFATTPRPFHAPHAAVVVGDPVTAGDWPRLPGARAEAETLARLYPSATLLTGRAATAARWRASLPGADALHFGAHAVVDARFPSRSKILLAGDVPELLAADVARERLSNVGLVTLAACQSALTTDGSVGSASLARSFLRAGAGSVLASLLPVSDADSKQVIEEFVGRVLRGETPSAALRATIAAAGRERKEMLGVALYAPLTM